MYEITRKDKKLSCNVNCAICGSAFEFIEDNNGEAIVTKVNKVASMSGARTESMNIEFYAKCNHCGYRTQYVGILKL